MTGTFRPHPASQRKPPLAAKRSPLAVIPAAAAAYNQGQLRLLASCLLATACAFALDACGASSTVNVVSVSIREGTKTNPVLVATVRPRAYHGRGWVIPLTAVRKDLPSLLPANIPQPAGRGIDRFVVVQLSSGQTITYGPLAYPSRITRVFVAMWAARRSGVGAASTSEAQADARNALTSWLIELRWRARQNPTRRFHNLPGRVFFARLDALAARYDFHVAREQILRPAQDAPLVIIQTDNPVAFSHAMPTIQRLLDPKQRTDDDHTGLAYEGFFLEARDSQGTPFLAIFNYWRGRDVGGGQWASRDSLLPYPHG